MISHIEAQVRQKLQQIHAVTLQKLAEDLACIKFPDRFGGRVLRRPGRNDEDQTTKGWPDAFVSTGENIVDGIEATRQAKTWKSHLEDDLKHAIDPNYRNLSGYVFVGGYPEDAPAAAQIDGWVDRFAAAGLSRSKVTILVGSDLVAELCRPEYAGVRQAHLGLAPELEWFRLLGHLPLSDRRLGLFQPTQNEYDNGTVRAPTITDAVVEDLLTVGCALVRGYGAAGKTTLAELIARQIRISPNAVWYADLAKAPEEEAGAALLNEMTELAARGTVFVVDNIHLDEVYASRIHDHWIRHSRPVGSRLLLLGRRTKPSGSRLASAIPSHELRAGIPEMLAVANRLAVREGLTLPQIPSQAESSWARTFGGSDKSTETAVDLIAFTAAVDRRVRQIATGDFRLSALDAVDAIRVRYLQPLQSSRELSNILRLAALAKFEIPLLDEQLPDPLAGLRDSVDILGLVVHDDLGLEARRHYRLVHAGVGPLLLEAIGTNFSERDERLAAVSQNPGLGLRIAAALRRVQPLADDHSEINAAVLCALASSTWPSKVSSFYELGRLARYAHREGVASPEAIDETIHSSNVIPRLLSRAPAVPALNHFLAYTTRIGLPRAAATIGAAAARSPIVDILGCSRPSDVAALIRAAPNGSEILARIDLRSWSDGQNLPPMEQVSETVSACRFFEASTRPELARIAALRQVVLADSKLWDHFDASLLSHLLRIAQPDSQAAKTLLDALTSSGWLSAAFSHGKDGHLCGALLSLANYLDPVLRSLILIPELEFRVIREITSPLAKRKHISRPVCLIGGFDVLGGKLDRVPQLDWSADPHAELILDEVAHSEVGDAIGMYEVQLWLGLKALHRLGQGPNTVPGERGESFLIRLGEAVPPTHEAAVIQTGLLEWLGQIRRSGWTLGAKA
ncbi:hypothetical protein [Bradyrhizobium tunisiense]|uniref:hypothetical protein n=1 Tax=Bradyrhizobium tunisiense TaxID=3278709 RepID=UPI0035DD68A2